jgi:microcystin-dependent protein
MRCIYVCCLVGLFFVSNVKATPAIVRVDGVLTGSSGLAVTGSRDIRFSAYSAASGGSSLWTSPVLQASLSEGRFSVALDASSGSPNLTAIINGLSTSGELWFEVTVDTGTSGNGSIDTAAVVSPRIRSKGALFAVSAHQATTASNATNIQGTSVSAALAPSSGQVLTYDGSQWSASSPAVASATGFVAITGSTMTGALVVPSIGVTSSNASSIAYIDSSKNITSTTATVTQAELQYLAGVTAALQAQLTSIVPVGTVLPYAGTSAPSGYLLCDGSTVSRTTYSALYSVIGTAFGSGNGSTTFHIPDLRGRFIRGRDGGSARDPDVSSRTAMNSGGNTGDSVGSIQGDQYKSHTHTYNTNSSNAVFSTPGGSGMDIRGTNNATTASSGGTETRPLNASMNFIMKF